MKKTNLVFTLLCLSSSIASAESVRLVINNHTNMAISQSKSIGASTQEVCVQSPSGDAEWCLPSIAGDAQEQTRKKSYQIHTFDSQGYSAADIAGFMNKSGKFGLVEIDPETSTPNSSPIPIQSDTTEQNSDDPQTGWQTPYLGSSEDLALGMNVFSLWDSVDVNTKTDPIDVVVMDSSFFDSPDVVYDDGRSFTTAALVPNGPPQLRNDDYSPRQESIDAGICTGHGLGVAGVVGATKDNDIAASGITNNINMHAIRVMTCGGGFLSDTGDALLWLTGEQYQGVSPYTGQPGVVNLSLGAGIDHCPNFFQSAIDRAIEAGFTIIVAAGNQYSDTSGRTPANCEGVIVVGALESDGQKAPFSNSGPEVDFVAAGTDVVAPCDSSESGCFWSGTSFSTPLTTGIFSVIKQATQAPSTTIETALKLTAKSNSLGLGCEPGYCGEGIPNASAALLLVEQLLSNKASSIEFAIGKNDACEQAWFVEYFSAPLNLCELYKVSFVPLDGVDDIQYQLLSVELESNWDQATIVGRYDSSVAFVENIDVANKKYGYQVCRTDQCLETILPLNTENAHESNRPVSCND